MKTLRIALAFALLGGVASAQEDVDAALKSLAEKLSKDGLSGKLAEAAATDAGLQAIHEKIDFLLAPRLSRLERDPLGAFEDHVFGVDENGDLKLRPELKPELDALALRLPTAARAMAEFNRRADDIVSRLGTFSEMDRRAKIAWSDPGFRSAFFHRHPAELRERDDAEILAAAGFRGLQAQPDGKLRVAGPYAHELTDRIAATFEQLEEVKRFEKSYLKLVTKVADPAARAALAGDAAALFLIGRVVRQANEGSPAPIGGLTEGDENEKTEPAIAFSVGLEEFLADFRDCEKGLATLKPIFDSIVEKLTGEGTEDLNAREFLKNDRVRLMLAERVLAAKQEQRSKATDIMNATLEESFAVDGERLTVKKGVYVTEAGVESPDALTQALNVVVEEFNGSIRQDFDRLAERCVDPEVIALFENRPATFLLMEYRDAVVERAMDSLRRQGYDLFVKAYLRKEGDLYVVRPDRAARVEALLRRVADIQQGK